MLFVICNAKKNRTEKQRNYVLIVHTSLQSSNFKFDSGTEVV